jgi:thiosulfate dehydrogenase [quinone] large subunit
MNEGGPTTRANGADVAVMKTQRFRNSWPTVPLRIFLAALFLFAGYAKLSYPRFFDTTSQIGFKATIDSAKADSPISGLLGPLSDHSSLFGHITAFAELAIGLGLLVGCLTRLAALGGMVLTALIALSVNWNGIKEYTGNGGWFTSVDLAVAAALSVYLLGGAGPLSIDRGWLVMRQRRHANEEGEPHFVGSSDSELEDSKRRLRGDESAPDFSTETMPAYHAPEPNSLWSNDRPDPTDTSSSSSPAPTAASAGAAPGPGQSTAQTRRIDPPPADRTPPERS